MREHPGFALRAERDAIQSTSDKELLRELREERRSYFGHLIASSPKAINLSLFPS
jgi:hypothetical protein